MLPLLFYATLTVFHQYITTILHFKLFWTWVCLWGWCLTWLAILFTFVLTSFYRRSNPGTLQNNVSVQSRLKALGFRTMAFTLSLSDPAREWLNKLINKDGQFKDLSVKIGYNPEGSWRNYANWNDFIKLDFATVSGHVESDYSVPHLNLGGQLEFEKSTSIPPELWEKLGSAKQCCHMGVFPQCRKAWLTVDSDFFIWNFDDGEDLAFYDGCQDIIIAVCLFRPKPGIIFFSRFF